MARVEELTPVAQYRAGLVSACGRTGGYLTSLDGISFLFLKTTFLSPMLHPERHGTKPEYYKGLTEGLIKRGFLGSDLELTEQGKLEVNFQKTEIVLGMSMKLPWNRFTQGMMVGAQRGYQEAAIARFEYWKKRVQQGEILSEDDRRRIVGPKYNLEYPGLFSEETLEKSFEREMAELAPSASTI